MDDIQEIRKAILDEYRGTEGLILRAVPFLRDGFSMAAIFVIFDGKIEAMHIEPVSPHDWCNLRPVYPSQHDAAKTEGQRAATGTASTSVPDNLTTNPATGKTQRTLRMRLVK